MLDDNILFEILVNIKSNEQLHKLTLLNKKCKTIIESDYFVGEWLLKHNPNKIILFMHSYKDLIYYLLLLLFTIIMCIMVYFNSVK